MVDYLAYTILSHPKAQEITKQDKHRCQLLILQTVEFETRQVGFDFALKQFIQSIISYFQKDNMQVHLPKLVINYYDFTLAEERIIKDNK